MSALLRLSPREVCAVVTATLAPLDPALRAEWDAALDPSVAQADALAARMARAPA